ncbi:hypothetical protein HDU92_002071 [Lobulomyces angularis]|nr:hypothetical protein HDU92_002071 [Lobulomyces angularis]
MIKITPRLHSLPADAPIPLYNPKTLSYSSFKSNEINFIKEEDGLVLPMEYYLPSELSFDFILSRLNLGSFILFGEYGRRVALVHDAIENVFPNYSSGGLLVRVRGNNKMHEIDLSGFTMVDVLMKCSKFDEIPLQ